MKNFLLPFSILFLTTLSLKAQDPCYNMDFENGFDGWEGDIGCHDSSSTGSCSGYSTAGIGPITAGDWVSGIYNYRQTLMPDTNVLSTNGNPYWPADGTDKCADFPTVYPDGGQHSVRMGAKTTGMQSERLYRTFNVQQQNAMFGYHYAVVVEDPNGHTTAESPYFEAMALDKDGDTIPCSYYFVNGSDVHGDYQNCTKLNGNDNDDTYYKDWDTKFIDLTAYIGEDVTIIFRTTDCLYGAHYAYAYIECFCTAVSAAGADTICEGATVTFTADDGADTYSWTGPNGFTANTQSITVSEEGTYDVHLTGTGITGCSADKTFELVVVPNFAAAFTFNTPCEGEATDFTNGSTMGGATYSWDFGDGSTSTDPHPSHVYGAAGTYDVTLDVNASNGCSSTITQTIEVFPVPQASFSGPDVCLNTPTTFTDASQTFGGTIDSYLWNFGDGNTSSDQNPTHIYGQEGNYTVTLTITAGSCVSTHSVPVEVYPMPVADFDVFPTPITVMDPEVTITDLSVGGTTGQWSFGDGTGADYVPGEDHTREYPVENIAGQQSYTITLNLTNAHGCPSMVRKSIEVEPFWSFYIPDAFTPNSDDKNETFYGKGVGILDYEMWIFDRWGNRIFHCDIEGLPQDPMCQWDGRVENGPSGLPAQQDVYVWVVNLTDIFHKKHRYVGHVSMVR